MFTSRLWGAPEPEGVGGLYLENGAKAEAASKERPNEGV